MKVALTLAAICAVAFGVAFIHANARQRGPAPKWEAVLGLGGYAGFILSMVAAALIALWS